MVADFVTHRAPQRGDRRLVAAVDVGTSSVRAGLFTLDGRMQARAATPIAINRPAPDHAEQSSTEIWAATRASLRAAIQAAGCDAADVAALAFGTVSIAAAAELGLTTACIVGVGVIDAQAGCLGPLASLPDERIEREMAIIGGTSTCHMAISRRPHHVPGVWGPYLATLLPERWLNEGGQSATGASLDHVVAGHAAATSLGAEPHAMLWREIDARNAAAPGGWLPRMVVVPDFNGNRSPLSDPGARGLVWGLTLDASRDSLIDLYAATAIGAVLGTRHVIEAMNAHGYAIERLHLIGGHARSHGFAQLYADATGCAVTLMQGEDGVLIGDAIIAATVLGAYPDLHHAARAFWRPGATLLPAPARARRLDGHYRAFRDLQAAGLAAGRLIPS